MDTGAIKSEREDRSSHHPMEEKQPESLYSRYTKGELLGQGACKRVYRGFDDELGIEVAWNEVPVSELACSSEKERDRVFGEIALLKHLKHKNVLALHDWWYDTKNSILVFITELFMDGSLRSYRRKHRNVDVTVLKRWAWQILQGLVYLHGHNPPIIHRDLKSDNIFVNGTSGILKIGDLGFATFRAGFSAAMSVIGTPEFMAPELYEERYNEKVDVYSFGLCLLELATLEYPYAECRNPAQIFKKVSSGVPPQGLAKILDDELRGFVQLCIHPNPEMRPEARQLLKHPFFDCIREVPRRPLPPHFLQNLQASGQLSHPHNLALGSPHDSPGLRSPATQVSPCTSFVSHVSRPPAPMSCEAPVPQPPPDNPQRPLSQPNIPVVSAATNTGVLSQLSSPIPRTANGTTSSTLLQQGPHTVLPGPSSIAASVGGVEQGAGPGNIAGMVGGQHIESPFGVEAVQQRSSLNGDLHEDLMYGSSQPVTSAATPQASPGVLPGTSTMSGRSALSGHESKEVAQEEAEESGMPIIGSSQNTRVRLSCRTDDDNMLAFSMSFVNDSGMRRKVGFQYDMQADTARDIADEMVENLSLDPKDAQFIADLIQAEIHKHEHTSALTAALQKASLEGQEPMYTLAMGDEEHLEMGAVQGVQEGEYRQDVGLGYEEEEEEEDPSCFF